MCYYSQRVIKLEEHIMKVFTRMHKIISEGFAQFPDLRVGKNKSIEMQDVFLSAFAVFFTQSKSFLEYQEYMQRNESRNNAKSIF